MEARSTGVEVQRRTQGLQLASAALFVVLGAVFTRGLVLALFVTEALGQCLLAAQGYTALGRGERVVRYFAREPLGYAAALVFLLTAWARYALALRVSAGARWVVLAAVGLTLLHVGAMAVRRVRMDLALGSALAGSGLVLGVALWGAGAPYAAASQLAYAAVILVGASALRPWQAELVNLVVFSSALALQGWD